MLDASPHHPTALPRELDKQVLQTHYLEPGDEFLALGAQSVVVQGFVFAADRLDAVDEGLKALRTSFETRAGESMPADGLGFVATKGQDPSGEWWIEGRYDGKERRSGRIQAVLVVHTDLARMPTVHIDCFANVEER